MDGTVTDIIAAAKDEFCTKFCKYAEECIEKIKNNEELRECPLDWL